jgi:hypothetical protein
VPTSTAWCTAGTFLGRFLGSGRAGEVPKGVVNTIKGLEQSDKFRVLIPEVPLQPGYPHVKEMGEPSPVPVLKCFGGATDAMHSKVRAELLKRVPANLPVGFMVEHTGRTDGEVRSVIDFIHANFTVKFLLVCKPRLTRSLPYRCATCLPL